MRINTGAAKPYVITLINDHGQGVFGKPKNWNANMADAFQDQCNQENAAARFRMDSQTS